MPTTRRGFTLLELMIAVSLMTAAIGIAIPFFIVQNRSLQSQAGRLDAQLNINFALDAIDRDLRVAGVGITQRQPLLVQATTDAITFNADLTSSTPSDYSAVYYDPDALVTTIGLLWPARKVTLPNSSWTYPDSAYWAGAGVPSSAETISYYIEPDSQAPGLHRMMRRVNDAPPRVMARGIKPVTGEPVFRYFKLNAVGALAEIGSGSLPTRHVPGWHGAPADTGVLATVDSVVLVRVKLTAVHRDPRYADAVRFEERTIRITNAGLIHASTCGEAPLGVTGVNAVADATPRVILSWSASIDEAAGEKDVERYAIYRRDGASGTFGEPIAMIASGSPIASFVDTDVKPGEAWAYGIAAQDCTPALSSMSTTPTLVIP